MQYQDYINLGFKRTDMQDNVEFKQTGYYGFFLEYKLNKRASISVNSGELDKPKLYIQKQDSECENFILVLEDNQVAEIIGENK